jgi:hypothetical protein
MKFQADLPDASAPTGTRYKVCLALSQGGLQWRRPNLGLVEWEGSRSNNILPWGENWMRRPNVILDPRDPDPNRRYKMSTGASTETANPGSGASTIRTCSAGTRRSGAT